MDNLKKIKDFISSVEELSEVDFDNAFLQVKKNYHRAAFSAKYNNELATVRYVLNKADRDKFTFANEKNTLLALEKDNNQFASRVLKYNDNELWIIESYLRGEPSGKSMTYDANFCEKVNPTNLITVLASYKNSRPKLTDIFDDLTDYYQKRFEHFERHWPEQERDCLEDWHRLFNQVIDNDLNNNFLAHGDVNPGNIIYEKSGLITGLIDWELAIYDGYWRDFAGAFSAAIDQADWQKRFKESIKIPNKEIISFNFYLFYHYADSMVNLIVMLEQNHNEIFRSGEMKPDQINSYIEKYLLLLKSIIYEEL